MPGRLLNDYDAWEIRVLRATAAPSREELAELYDVPRKIINDVLAGRTYAEAGGPLDGFNRRDLKHGTPAGVQRGCRCFPCAEANRVKVREYRARKKKEEERIASADHAADSGTCGVHGDT